MSQEALMAMLDDAAQRTHALRRIEYVTASRVVTVRRNGWMVVRVMGAGGGGDSTHNRVGNPGTVGLTAVRVSAGAQYVCTLPAHGYIGDYTGGALTVTGPGVNIVVPGGRSGFAAEPTQPNDAPTGLDTFFIGFYRDSPFGAPPRFWGRAEHEMGPSWDQEARESAIARLPREACVLLNPPKELLHSVGPAGYGSNGMSSPGFVTLEFLEDTL